MYLNLKLQESVIIALLDIVATNNDCTLITITAKLLIEDYKDLHLKSQCLLKDSVALSVPQEDGYQRW